MSHSDVSRILHIFGRMERGGAELRTLDVMRCVDRDRFQLLYCALSGLQGELDDEIRELGGEVYYCRLDPSFPIGFYRLLRKLRVNVVHSHVHHSSGLMLLIAAIAKVPVRIAHFRSTGDGRASTLRRRAQRWMFKRCIDLTATSIIGVSEGALAAGWSPDWRNDKRCRVIYNGVEIHPPLDQPERDHIRRQLNLRPDDLVVINVGRMVPEKNHLRLIDIFAAIREREPRAQLLLVGRRDERIESAIDKRAESLGIRDAVTIAGERADVPALMGAADLLLFPSVREGLPGVVLEAIASGLPVLSSDLPGMVEIRSYIPVVELCSLSTDDRLWAERAVGLLARNRQEACRGASRNALSTSPFTLRKATEAITHTWESQRAKP